MDESMLITLTRRYLGDKSGMVWSDSEINAMLERAADHYSEDAGCYRGSFPFYPDESGKYHYPDDYIHFLAGWSDIGCSICAISSTELEHYYRDYVNVKGLPEFIYDDLDSPGEFRLCPNPSDMQGAFYVSYAGAYGEFITDPSLYGEIVSHRGSEQSDEYGVDAAFDYGIMQPCSSYGTISDLNVYRFAGDYGTVITEDYGVSSDGYGTFLAAVRYVFAGDIVYARYASVSEIKDYMALVYHAAYQAFDTDSDFGNAERAAFYKGKYDARMGMFGQVKHRNAGQAKAANFF